MSEAANGVVLTFLSVCKVYTWNAGGKKQMLIFMPSICLSIEYQGPNYHWNKFAHYPPT